MKLRTCKKCTRELPLDSEHFKTSKLCPDGFYKTCRGCVAQYTPEYGRMKQLDRRYKMTVEQYEEKLEQQGGHCALCPNVQGTHKRRLTVDHDHACCPEDISCGECLRGILCANCNRKVGFLEETLKDTIGSTLSPLPGTWLAAAIQYLDSYAVQFDFGYNSLSPSA